MMKRVLLSLLLLTATPVFAQVREVSVGVEFEDLPGDEWQQVYTALRYGQVIARATHGERGDASDEQFEVEAYPRFAPKTYAYLAAAFSNDGVLYPDWRIGAELHHGFGKGFEVSAGIRHLAFDEEVDLVTASIGKYVGNWLFIGRIYHADDADSWQVVARRYFGDDGSWLGVRAGTARDEIRSDVDVRSLDRNEGAIEGAYIAPSKWIVHGRAGASDDGLIAAIALGRRF